VYLRDCSLRRGLWLCHSTLRRAFGSPVEVRVLSEATPQNLEAQPPILIRPVLGEPKAHRYVLRRRRGSWLSQQTPLTIGRTLVTILSQHLADLPPAARAGNSTCFAFLGLTPQALCFHLLRRFRSVRISALFAAFLLLIILITIPALGQKPKRRDPNQREEREEREEDQRKQVNKSEQQSWQAPERQVDDPNDAEELNQELWEFARRTPYKEILPYVAAEQRESKANQVSEVELPNGWRIAPAGTQVDVGRLPLEAMMFAGKLVVLDTGYYYQEPQAVSIVEPQTAQVIKTIRLNSLFPSAVVGGDGDLYISGGFDQKVYRFDRNFEQVREYPVRGFVGGLAAIDEQHLAVCYMAIKGKGGGFEGGGLAMLNTVTGEIERETAAGYYPYTVRYLSGKLFVTVLGENKVLVFDRNFNLLKTITVGRTPQESCTDGRRLFVANTGSDSLSVIDTQTERIVSTIPLAEKGSHFGAAPSSCVVANNRLYVTLANTNAVAVLDRTTYKRSGLIPTGWYPTKVLADQEHLFVLNAKGIRPRWPNPNGPQGAGPSRVAGYVLNLVMGTVSIIAQSEVQQNQASWTRQVNQSGPLFDPRAGFKLPIKYVFYIIKENRTYDQVLGDLAHGNGDPKLTLFGREITPIQHQLAEEFVTLDNFFCNGEISVLGHSFTTSGYASPFIQWFGNLTYAYRWNLKNNPCAKPGVTCPTSGYPFGMVPAMTSPAYLWDRLDEKGIDYRIYGENYFLFTRAYKIFTDLYGPEGELSRKFYEKVVKASKGSDRGTEFNQLAAGYADRAKTREDAYQLLGDSGFASRLSHFLTGDYTLVKYLQKNVRLRRRMADYLYHYPFSFRSWELKYSDLDRVREWKKDFEVQLKSRNVARLQYIWLPNDHTDGASKRPLDAFQFVAQNDAAVGSVIDNISHSSIWSESLILVVEDDAQNGPDHVDADRTIAFAAGPYVKRGALVSDRYDQLSMLRTIEIVLGLDPINLGDRMAAPMFGIFTSKPDFTPFKPTRVSERLATADRERYEGLAR
jgi:YVTN family beta-propeller protein